MNTVPILILWFYYFLQQLSVLKISQNRFRPERKNIGLGNKYLNLQVNEEPDGSQEILKGNFFFLLLKLLIHYDKEMVDC